MAYDSLSNPAPPAAPQTIGPGRAVTGEATAFAELAAQEVTPFWARRYAQAVLGAWHLPADAIDKAVLLISEVVTNAITAAIPGPASLPGSWLDDAQRICLTLRLLHDRIVIEVFDNDPRRPVLTEADTDAESGRGLMLVDALSKEWGFFFLPTGGKVVYCVIALEP